MYYNIDCPSYQTNDNIDIKIFLKLTKTQYL